MTEKQSTWLDGIVAANAAFIGRVHIDKLPVARTPSPYAVITCMDPRVNLECIGIRPFGDEGEGRSHVRVIRTIGGMSDSRSLVIALFLAGVQELAIVMHTDCGCCLAASKIDTIVQNLERTLGNARFGHFRAQIGEPFGERLGIWLKVFRDPRDAVRREVQLVRGLPFVPESVPVHGMVFELATGKIDVVVNGYD